MWEKLCKYRSKKDQRKVTNYSWCRLMNFRNSEACLTAGVNCEGGGQVVGSLQLPLLWVFSAPSGDRLEKWSGSGVRISKNTLEFCPYFSVYLSLPLTNNYVWSEMAAVSLVPPNCIQIFLTNPNLKPFRKGNSRKCSSN